MPVAMCPACLASLGMTIAAAGTTAAAAAVAAKKWIERRPKVRPGGARMERPRIVSREEWIAARTKLLVKEKALDVQRDALAAERRALPWVRVEKAYAFEGPGGRTSLRELFAGRKQLVVYHFMFAPEWAEGCRSCSLVADTFDGGSLHLPARDVAFAAVSRAPIEKLEAFKQRMGWRFRWVSSAGSDFNYDFHVSFPASEVEAGSVLYNYARRPFPVTEGPGVSVFLRDGDEVFHTYSTYGRGVDLLISTYNYLDLTPAGRNEAPGEGMSWVRHHDRYELG